MYIYIYIYIRQMVVLQNYNCKFHKYWEIWYENQEMKQFVRTYLATYNKYSNTYHYIVINDVINNKLFQYKHRIGCIDISYQ